VYNTIIGPLTLNGPSPFALLFGAGNPVTWALDYLVLVALLAGFVLLPVVAYYRITGAHRRSAGILLIVAGVLLIATFIRSVATVIGGILFLAAGALALVSRPGEEPPVHVAETLLPINR
jgi:FtsH-binding integral membrane protein